MTRKVRVMHQRVNKKDWLHEKRGKHAASTPKIPEVPTQTLMQAHASDEPATVLLGKKYKPVAEKIMPILGELPAKFHIERKIVGDPLKDMPVLEMHPPDFVPMGHYMEERMQAINASHDTGFLEPEASTSLCRSSQRGFHVGGR
jgi:hypothetical protein